MDSIPAYNIVDIVAAVVIFAGMVWGVKRGLSGELAGLLSAAAALFAGWYFFQPVGDYMAEHTRLSPRASQAAAFVAVLAGAWILMKILRIVLRSVMEFSFKGNIERVGGGLAGLVRATVVVAAIILMVGLWPHPYLQRLFVEDSLAGRNLVTWLGPVYDELTEKYPILPRPEREGGALDEEEPGRDKEVEQETEPREESPDARPSPERTP